MSPFFNKKPRVLDKRRRHIERELERVEDHIQLLARRVEKAGGIVPEPGWGGLPAAFGGDPLPKPEAVRTILRRRRARSTGTVQRVVPVAPVEAVPPVESARPEAAEGAMPPEAREPDLPAPDDVKRFVKEQGKRLRDERFSDYLSTSFQTERPLRTERRAQRNKAIVMLAFVVLVSLWLLSRFFL